MIGRVLCRLQFLAAYQALSGLLAHPGFFAVGQARCHGAGRHKHHGQMAEVQGTDEQAGNDLVTDAQHQGRIESVMRERHGGGHGDGVTAEQAQLHAGHALCHAVAHGGYTAGHLGRGAVAPGLVFQNIGVMRKRRMGREHIVIGRDDADVRPFFLDDANLVGTGQGGKGMGHIGAAHGAHLRRSRGHGIDLGQIVRTAGLAALLNALRHLGQNGVDCHDENLSKALPRESFGRSRGSGLVGASYSVYQSFEYAKAKRRQCCSTASEADKVIG